MSVTYTSINGVLVHENRGGTERDYMPDTLGSTAAVLNSSQAKAASWKYWPYGEIRATGGSSPTRFLYCGTLGYRSDDSVRAYIRARELDEKKARWMQVDPLWPKESSFVYARSSPIIFIDPFGRQSGWGMLPHLGGPTFVPETPCTECYDCLNDVYREMGTIYPGIGGVNNTLRHCVGACAAKRRCGPVCAWAIFLHEVQSWWKQDSKCDRWNNHMGFQVAASSETCYRGCKNLLDAGLLCPPVDLPTNEPPGGGGIGAPGHLPWVPPGPSRIPRSSTGVVFLE